MTLEEALDRVATGMERGDYVDMTSPLVTVGLVVSPDRRAPTADGKRLFHIHSWASYSLASCGTVCCTGGWAEHELGRRLTHSEKEDTDMLFYPYGVEYVDVKKAARAVRRWLGGERDLTKLWEER